MLEKGVMEISLLKDLLNNLSQFNNLSSSDNIKSEPVQKYYRKINEIVKLLKPILDLIVDSQIASDEQLNNALKMLDELINESRELFDSWHPMTSKVYFVNQIESQLATTRASCLEVLGRLNALELYMPADLTSASIELCMQKIQGIGYEQTLNVIKDAIRDLLENSLPSSENLVKIADALSLKSNQELLMEAVALEKVKLQAELVEKDGEAEHIGNMIALVTHMHDLLVKIKQSQSNAAVPIPADFCCPISLELMTDPVIVASGQTYERLFIRKWLDLGLTVCPKTRQSLAHTNLIPNYTVKALIANWCESNNVKLPDPVKSVSLNQPAALLARTESSLRDSNVLPPYASTRTSYPRSPESIRSTGSPYKSLFSSNGALRERASPSHPRSASDGNVSSRIGNGFELDAGRTSLGSSGERETNSEDRNIGSGGHTSMSSRMEFSDVNGADEQFKSHSRSASVSSTVSDRGYREGANEGSRVSSDLARYSSDASGEVMSGSLAPASTAPHAEPELTSRFAEARSRSQTIWRRPTERFSPRMTSSLSTIDTRADLTGLETQVRALVEDLKSTSVDLQRAATSELRLLAKHNMDNRIVIANCGAISLLVGLLRSVDSKIQEDAVTALLNLSINDNNKSAIANADAIGPLIYVLETGSAEAKENSAATLFSLSVVEENKIRIGQSGAIRPLVELVGNGTPRGKKDAATALFNLSIFHENKARIVQAGAVKYLVELMDPAAGMVDKAVAVLANLATIPEGRSAIGLGGGIPVLVEVVELGSARGKENAAAALLQLCTNSSRFCSMVLQEGAVPPLVALSQSGTPRAKEKAQALLSYFRNQRHGNAGRG
ncbi:hypothetical protein MKW98_019187 [Papaver atlanticum]|uniref:RING-type E3 ubiquitin transferase n=1 Tax=Papaver atlanticum TaxID=357466 RepID=A0AAD4TCB9_9MAGN|nr:hypothetical protein MKW98_019187 [Papaver atlanticum]